MSDEPSGSGAKRFVRPLPSNPNLDMQRKLAKALARDYWRGAPQAIERVRAAHPKAPAPQDFVLSDAHLVIAREYGFAGWPQLKRKINSLTKSPADLFKAAVEAGDVDDVRQLLQSHLDLVARINAPIFAFKSQAVHVARTNLALLDLLLANGADLNARTGWEKGGFGVLEQVGPDEAVPLIARGARIDVWAAANLGMMAELAALIAVDPALVHAKGGDGKRPCISRARSRSRDFCSSTAPRSTRATTTTSPHRRSISLVIARRSQGSSSRGAHNPTCCSLQRSVTSRWCGAISTQTRARLP
jgi:hypothetical protein